MHSCKAHAKKSIGKSRIRPAGLSTSNKDYDDDDDDGNIVTHENFNLKLGIHDDVTDITHHAAFGLIWFIVASRNRCDITLL